MVNRRICRIIVRHLSGDSTPAEKKELDAWRALPGNEKIFLEIETIWRVTGSMSPEAWVDTDKAWQKFHASASALPAPSRKAKRVSYFVLRVAAALVTLIATILLIRNIPDTDPLFA